MNDLIAADEVTGTDVFNPAGEKLGRIEKIMIDKVSGKALYAIMSFGGFHGFGNAHFPLPWAKLKYDATMNGYVINITAQAIAGAPSYDSSGKFDWTLEQGREIEQFYNTPSSFLDRSS